MPGERPTQLNDAFGRAVDAQRSSGASYALEAGLPAVERLLPEIGGA